MRPEIDDRDRSYAVAEALNIGDTVYLRRDVFRAGEKAIAAGDDGIVLSVSNAGTLGIVLSLNVAGRLVHNVSAGAVDAG